MASTKEEKFYKACEDKAFDLHHKEILKNNLANYHENFSRESERFFDLENSKKKAHLLKWRSIENIERYLLDFESNFINAGGQVIWANTSEEALTEITKVIHEISPNEINKSHAMIFEEIGLCDHLKKESISYRESDFGRHLLDLTESKPTHVVNPTLHWNFEDIKDIYSKNHPIEDLEQPENLLNDFYATSSSTLYDSEVAISGASFLVADTGSVVISENEGHILSAASVSKTNIVVVGIDKIIASVSDLDILLPLGSTYDYGQPLNTFHHLLHGPGKASSYSSDHRFIVILVDNGRTNILAEKELRQGLYRMECGASSNNCVLYHTIGGAAYQTKYPGPMGAVFTPLLEDKAEEYNYLSSAVSFSNGDERNNTLNIDIQQLLLLNRKKQVQKVLQTKSASSTWKWYVRVAKNRKYLDFFGKGWKNFIFRWIFKKSWGSRREFPIFKTKSFASQWSEQVKTLDKE